MTPSLPLAALTVSRRVPSRRRLTTVLYCTVYSSVLFCLLCAPLTNSASFRFDSIRFLAALSLIDTFDSTRPVGLRFGSLQWPAAVPAVNCIRQRYCACGRVQYSARRAVLECAFAGVTSSLPARVIFWSSVSTRLDSAPVPTRVRSRVALLSLIIPHARCKVQRYRFALSSRVSAPPTHRVCAAAREL